MTHFSEILFTDEGANPNVDLHHRDDLDSSNEEVDPNSEVLAHVELAQSVCEFAIMGTQESDPNLVCCQNRKPLLQILHFKSINLPFWNLFDVSHMINNILTVLSHQLMCHCMHVHPSMA